MQPNAIIGTPNILFLGAGASKPYGKLLMGEFIETFRAKNEELKSSRLLDAICDKKADLEFLIEELEGLSSRRYLENQSVDLNPPGSGGGESPRWPDFIKLAIDARILLARLKEEVYHAYRNISDVSKTLYLPGQLPYSGLHLALSSYLRRTTTQLLRTSAPAKA